MLSCSSKPYFILSIYTSSADPIQTSKSLTPTHTSVPPLLSISGSNPFLHHRRFPCSISFSFSLPTRRLASKRCRFSSSPFPSPVCSSSSARTSVEHEEYVESTDNEIESDVSSNEDVEAFTFDSSFDSTDLKRFDSGLVEVKELEELPELWRRSKLAWLCKELPAHKGATAIRVLNAQRKWIRQEDATYVAVHCMRIRENDTGFMVYKWMMQQHWFRFDFALATKLADYLGKSKKYLKCREIFDDIINQGRVPSESTFHMLIVSYLSSSDHRCLEEACSIYNRMIQLGGYKPEPHLHNSLFRALVSRPGRSCKHFLKQAEFIYHNLTTFGLKVHKDVYSGLIWLHSFQDSIDEKRIAALRAEMLSNGIKEDRVLLVSILRAYSKEGDIEEAEKTWDKLLSHDNDPPPAAAFVYAMQFYSRIGEPLKSLALFRRLQKTGWKNVKPYQKIIEVFCNAQNTDHAESLMVEFINSGLKPLAPALMNLMKMYSNLRLYDKLEAAFFQCLEKCEPNRVMYNIYLDSVIQCRDIERAEAIFNQMYGDGKIGINSSSCNSILKGYLSRGEYTKAEKIHDLMCQKKYNVDLESELMEKLDYALSLRKNAKNTKVKQMLTKEQREIIMGMLLGGLQIKTDDKRKKSVVIFDFDENLETHCVLRQHVYDQYHEWLRHDNQLVDDVPFYYTTSPHAHFTFYADQFLQDVKPVVPKLIHRWLSSPVLAYWYMYGGQRTSKGDILLKLKGNREGVERLVKSLKAKNLDCRVKRRGGVYWIGFLGSNSLSFWRLVEPFVLDDLKNILQTDRISSKRQEENEASNFKSGSEDDEKVCANSIDDELL